MLTKEVDFNEYVILDNKLENIYIYFNGTWIIMSKAPELYFCQLFFILAIKFVDKGHATTLFRIIQVELMCCSFIVTHNVHLPQIKLLRNELTSCYFPFPFGLINRWNA